MKTEPKIDHYILNAEHFAQPVLIHLRELVHMACPETEEKVKWSFPHFDYKGPMCSMAALESFEKFSYSHKKEYLEWVTEAKREETRQERMKKTLALLAEGKSRNWKYER